MNYSYESREYGKGQPELSCKIDNSGCPIVSEANFYSYKAALYYIRNYLDKLSTKIMINSIPKSKIKKGILIKLPKANQDLRVDLPTIGIDTFKDCNKVGVKGIVVKSNQNIILNKEVSIKYANQNKLFLIAI